MWKARGDRVITGWNNVWRKKRVCRTLPHRLFVLVIVGRLKVFTIVHHPFVGWITARLHYRMATSGREDVKINHWKVKEMKKVKAPKSGDGAVDFLCSPKSEIFKMVPALLSHITTTRYDDGEARTPGWWTIKTMGASCCIQVKDPDSCMSFQVLAQTVDDALVTADALLAAEQAPWEPDRWLAQNKPRSKKVVDKG